MKPWIGLALLLATPPALAEQASWDIAFYDPHQAAGDLQLPLPCGGTMTFRPVEVPTTNAPLDDRPVPVGDPDPAFGIAEYVRSENLAAPFPTPDGGRRYWIGKYVVTRDQFAAMRGTCRPPSFGGRVAQTDVAQIDAMMAASDWSSWLLAHARDVLPKRGNEFAYVRLPTEIEWEFAARGGTKVGAEAFQDRLWPMPEGIEHYVVAGQIADGRPQQIGAAALPNPLGLYDVLGSVDQMLLEPFHLNRVGRLQGDAGGIILRGGNYKEDPGSLHTGERREMRPFDPAKNQPTRTSTAGFRLVLSAPTAGDAREVAAEEQEFAALSQEHSNALASDDLRKLLALMRGDATSPLQAHALDLLDASLASAERARADQDRDALRAEIEAATTMANFVWLLERNARVVNLVIGYVKATAERTAAQGNVTQAPSYVNDFETHQRRAVEAIRAEQDASLDGYMRFLREIAGGPAWQELDAQAAVVRKEMQDRGQHQPEAFLSVVTQHARALHNSSGLTADGARRDILAVPEARSGQ